MQDETFWATLRAFQESRVLLTALELDLFDAVGTGADALTVAKRVGAHVRGTEILLDAVAALGFVHKRDKRYENSSFAFRYLVDGAKHDARLALMHRVHQWDRWSGLTDAVRLGHAPQIPGLADRGAEWIEAFIGAMHWHGQTRAESLAGALKLEGVERILDLGGGSGAYSMALARTAPQAEIVLFDLPEVIELARKYVEAEGLGDRVHFLAGDMLKDDLGHDYDLVLLSSICHMFSPEQNQHLLGRVARVLRPAGRVVIHDFILQPDKTGPRSAALFSVNMLVSTEQGAAYSEPEYRAWIEYAGFEDLEVVPIPGPSDLVVAQRVGEQSMS